MKDIELLNEFGREVMNRPYKSSIESFERMSLGKSVRKDLFEVNKLSKNEKFEIMYDDNGEVFNWVEWYYE